MKAPTDPIREPRDLALQVLYQADQRKVSPREVFDDLPAKAFRLVEGVAEHVEELDAAIDAVSARWRVARMPPVDRAILRIGLFELRYEPKTPMAVVVSEAVRLANLYSTDRSGSFVNGILDSVSREEREVPG